jgi:hypothetical protein
LNLLREESLHFKPIAGPVHSGWIENLVLASAEYCNVWAARAFELETRAAVGGASFSGPMERGAAELSANGLKEAAAEPERVPDGNSTTRQGHRSEVQAYKIKHGLKTNAMAARRLGVSVDTLKSIMSSKGELRCSQETLGSVLRKIGDKEA